jgi:hypothetical protein
VLAGFGGRPGQIDRAQVCHGRDLVIASDWTDRHSDTRLALEASVGKGSGWPDASPAAISIWISAQDRVRRRKVAMAEPLTTLIEIDGQSISASGLSVDDAWALTARTPASTLTISGRGSPPTRLIRIVDPVSELEEVR